MEYSLSEKNLIRLCQKAPNGISMFELFLGPKLFLIRIHQVLFFILLSKVHPATYHNLKVVFLFRYIFEFNIKTRLK